MPMGLNGVMRYNAIIIMGLKGRFTMPDTSLVVRSAYISLYDSRLMIDTLRENDLRRRIYGGEEPPPDFFEAGGEAGKYHIQGYVNAYATHQARKDNKTKIGGMPSLFNVPLSWG